MPAASSLVLGIMGQRSKLVCLLHMITHSSADDVEHHDHYYHHHQAQHYHHYNCYHDYDYCWCVMIVVTTVSVDSPHKRYPTRRLSIANLA